MNTILNLEEAKEWCEQNLYDADCYFSPLNVAVKRGLLKEVDKEHFEIVEKQECIENGVRRYEAYRNRLYTKRITTNIHSLYKLWG